MVRNALWSLATVAAVALVLVYPTSANEGVPLGRTSGGHSAAVKKPKNAPSMNRTAPAKPLPSR
jgi:hypothetical protein